MMAGAQWDASRALEGIRADAYRALDDAGEFLGETANRTVPLEEATLEGSMLVTTDRARLVTVVSYDTPYAVRQHEDLTMRHDPGRRAKWLELTFTEQAPRLERFLADRMRAGG